MEPHGRNTVSQREQCTHQSSLLELLQSIWSTVCVCGGWGLGGGERSGVGCVWGEEVGRNRNRAHIGLRSPYLVSTGSINRYQAPEKGLENYQECASKHEALRWGSLSPKSKAQTAWSCVVFGTSEVLNSCLFGGMSKWKVSPGLYNTW